jgi:hypothetical protein
MHRSDGPMRHDSTHGHEPSRVVRCDGAGGLAQLVGGDPVVPAAAPAAVRVPQRRSASARGHAHPHVVDAPARAEEHLRAAAKGKL